MWFSSLYLQFVEQSVGITASLGAHDTGQFFLSVVRWAREFIAGGLSVPECSRSCVCITAWYTLWIFVYALKH